LALLPNWTHPLGRFVFLSWGSDLVRESISAPVVDGAARRVLIVVALGLAGFLVGQRLFRTIIRRIRISGEIASP
jgi:ABC-2 type transport system permease protein